MTTERNGKLFEFHLLGTREVGGGFDGGAIASDGGGLLIREVEKRTGMVERFVTWVSDHWEAERVEHTARELVAQRELERIVKQIQEAWPGVKIIMGGGKSGKRDVCTESYIARGERWRTASKNPWADGLFADRTGTAFMRSNQVRLYISALAYLMMEALRRLGSKETGLAQAQVMTIWMKVLKIGDLIRVTLRMVWIALLGGCPNAELWATIWGSFSSFPCGAEPRGRGLC